MFLGIFYQGELSSSITALLPPVVPTTLEQLSDSGLLIVTQASFQEGFGKVWKSTFLHMIDQYLNSSKINNPVAGYLANIRNNTRWVDFYAFDLANNISFGLQIYDREGKEIHLGQGRIFAFLDDNWQTALFEACIQYQGELIVIGNRESFPFEITRPMLLRKTFLQPILSRTFRQLSISGILMKWDRLTFQNGIVNRVRESIKNISKSYILGRQLANSKFIKTNSNKSSVTLESMKYFFLVFIMLLVIALVAGFIEVLGCRSVDLIVHINILMENRFSAT